MAEAFRGGRHVLPLPGILRKIFETKNLGSDLGLKSAGLNVAVRLAPDWCSDGLNYSWCVKDWIGWVAQGMNLAGRGLNVAYGESPCGKGVR